jgi:hypothetical protein
MDEPGKPQRRWWRKKRWWAVGLLWLALGYPASLGPYGYVRGYRGLGRYNLPRFYTVLLPPGLYFHEKGGFVRHALGRYYDQCFSLGAEHSPLGPLP